MVGLNKIKAIKTLFNAGKDEKSIKFISDCFLRGDLSYEEIKNTFEGFGQEEIDGEVIFTDRTKILISYIRDNITDYIVKYRYENQLFFMYDGHKQKWKPYDAQRMNDIGELLLNGQIEEINWKYPFENTSKKVIDGNYLIRMKEEGYINEDQCRRTEYHIIAQYQNLTDEELLYWDYKKAFDEKLKEIRGE